jgi:hypothetical protein
MGLNLHAVVRPAINAVNPDLYGTWQQSTGATSQTNFKRTPNFTTFTNVPMQVQAMSGGDLQKVNYLNLEKVTRAVYLYGNPQGVVRVDAKGGDLLLFPQLLGGDIYTWLVFNVLEPWTSSIEGGGWTKVAVVLQDVPPS